jgi:murein DD-endopeptidase MepM/ murein hydrolase activator NlpD
VYKLAQQVYQSGYGFGHGGWHRGIDYRDKLSPNSSLYSPFANGKILHTGTYPTYGNTMVFQDAATGNVGMYSHLDNFKLKAGDSFTNKDILAVSGRSGLGPGAEHLHAELLKSNVADLVRSGKFNPNDKSLMQYAINSPGTFKGVFGPGSVGSIANNTSSLVKTTRVVKPNDTGKKMAAKLLLEMSNSNRPATELAKSIAPKSNRIASTMKAFDNIKKTMFLKG